jgi:tRNA modification GTPase
VRPRAESLIDTIAALATPLGRAALAVVRVSGRDTLPILSRIVRGAALPLPPRRPTLVSFVDSRGQMIDRGLLTVFPGPASATGEDVGELSVHGSPIVVEGLLSAIVHAGARLARAGEFTERAFVLGKIDLVEAEATRDLIEARTPAAAYVSTRRLEGKLSARLAAVREALLDVATSLTATIDFSEDVGDAVSSETVSCLSGVVAELERLAATYKTGRLLAAGCRVVILGPPNAGKSTLFNALVGSERAIVTEIPGTTRDTLDATIDVEGIPVEIVDTAGLRETEDRVERIGVERAREIAERADAVLYVFDAGAGWSREDAQAVCAFDGKPVVTLANKVDTLPAGVSPERGLPLCGLSPDAGPRLRDVLRETVGAGTRIESTCDVLGTLRQRDLVDGARTAAAAAVASIGSGESPEYAATHINGALDALADLVGETTSEDVLRRIFSTFCIGK